MEEENKSIEPENNWRKYEREFVIQGSEGSDDIQIYCASSVFATKLRKAGIIPEPDTIAEDGSFTVKAKKSQLSLRQDNSDKPKRQMTDEQKKAVAERFAKARKEKEEKESR